MEELYKQLKGIKTSNIIALLFIFASLLSFISNKYYYDYLIKKDKMGKKEAQKIIITQLVLLLILNIYLTYQYYQAYQNKIKKHQDPRLEQGRLIAGIIFVIGTIILIYYQMNNQTYSDVDPI